MAASGFAYLTLLFLIETDLLWRLKTCICAFRRRRGLVSGSCSSALGRSPTEATLPQGRGRAVAHSESLSTQQWLGCTCTQDSAWRRIHSPPELGNLHLSRGGAAR